MRFLVLTQFYLPEIGASQIRLAALARELQSRGHEVEVTTAMPHHLVGQIFPQYRGKFYVKEKCEGVSVRRTWVYAATGTGLKRLVNYLSFTVTSLYGLFKASRPDYVFVESPPLFLGISSTIYGGIRRIPFIFHVADLWPDSVRELGVLSDGLIYRLAAALEAWIYRRARFVSTPTPTMVETLRTSKKVPDQKLLFFPNGVDTELFSPRPFDSALAKELGVENKKVILYAGTHGAAQGLEVILQAAERLRETDIVFVLVGEGHTKPHLVEQAESMGLANVVFVDPQPLEEMPRFFSIAVASVVPLLKRDLFKGARPSKIFTALAAGVPVIYCGEGETANLLESTMAGVAVAPEDDGQLANAAVRLSNDVQLRHGMSANGRRLVIERYSWGTIVDELLSQLQAKSAR